MKKILLLTAIISFMIPVGAEEITDTTSTVTSTESVRSFTRPYDSRFQYSLPERGTFKFPPKKSSTVSTKTEGDEEDAIELDTTNIKPAKKVIKKLSSDSAIQNKTFDASDMPMNYGNFPKYYDPNDMSTQQFMPMMGY